ncbi:MAG: M23 family metallopeptidase [Deltaproteobacteria bacterium]|nr:M23 family metallopeptidase [Deltaproteobacteria bacterium]
MGMGGDSSAEENYFSTPAAKKDELVKKMRDEITQLEEMAKSQESSFTELQEYLMKKSSFLAATPSIWPSRGWVTSAFGERISPFTGFPQMHRGLDIANRVGTPVVASAEGIVVHVGADTGLGKMVSISHGYGIKTSYGHLSEIKVRTGQKVKRGMEIGTMGNTGRSTGPHLHYEVSLNGVSVNPTKYILN